MLKKNIHIYLSICRCIKTKAEIQNTICVVVIKVLHNVRSIVFGVIPFEFSTNASANVK